MAEQAEDTSCFCETCGKHFNTANAYSNHLKSKKHRDTAAKDDKCLLPEPDVQHVNAKNAGKITDLTYSGDQRQRNSKARSSSGEMEASGGVGENPQLDKDVGMFVCLFAYFLKFVSFKRARWQSGTVLDLRSRG